MIRSFFSQIFAAKGKILLVAAVLITLRCMWLWQPERQVQLHQQHFLEAVQDRNWSKFYGFLDDSFHLPNGHDKVWTLQISRQVIGQFLSLKIDTSDTTTTIGKDTANIRTLIRVKGNGMELAEAAKNAVNGSNDPFEFTWKHRSWKPWDWALVSVEHPLLHTDPGME